MPMWCQVSAQMMCMELTNSCIYGVRRVRVSCLGSNWSGVQVMICLQIWDTAGEDQADLLDSSFWSNASGAVIVCNLHRKDCINSLTFWQSKLQEVQLYVIPILASMACDPFCHCDRNRIICRNSLCDAF